MKSNNGVVAIQSPLVNLQMVSNHQDEEGDVEYDEFHQLLEIINDKQSFPDTKVAYASRYMFSCLYRSKFLGKYLNSIFGGCSSGESL